MLVDPLVDVPALTDTVVQRVRLLTPLPHPSPHHRCIQCGKVKVVEAETDEAVALNVAKSHHPAAELPGNMSASTDVAARTAICRPCCMSAQPGRDMQPYGRIRVL